MTEENLRAYIMALLQEASLGQVLDVIQDLAIAKGESLRDVDRITAVTWTTASLKIGEAARFALNVGI